MRLMSRKLAAVLGALMILNFAPGLRAQPVETNLVSLNAVWRYNHADCLDAVGWMATNYNDTIGNWLSGPGGFTGGETRVEALVGVTTTTLPAPNAVGRSGRAMYFRTTFNVASTAALSLIFSNRVDDNAAFYLNGQLVQRLRLTANPILCGSFGAINPYAGNDATDWDVFTLTPAQLAGVLVAGTNTLAVEVHQSGTASSDMVFVCAVTASIADTNPPPTLRMPAEAPPLGFTFVNAFPGLAGISGPVAFATPAGETNRLFVLERSGRLVVITNLAAPTRTVVMDFGAGRISIGGENGLLGLALHPGFNTNGYFFLFYSTTATTAAPGATNTPHQRVSRFQMTTPGGNSALTNTELPLITQNDEASNHNGGDLHFGPDGYLYISYGDEGDQNDARNNSQTIRKDFFSGILRIDVDKRPGNLDPNPHPSLQDATNYFVPADNPWVSANLVGELNPGGVKRTEFYAVGLRNPWRFSFDPVTGWLWCGDVGGGAREEVDIITSGGNYGWAFREGFTTGVKANTGGGVALNPIRDYPHGSSGTNVGNSITGGLVYRGTRLPELTGWYVYADYTAPGNVWAMFYDGTTGTNSQNRWLFQDQNIVAFGRDPRNGDVLAADLGDSQIKRLTYDTNASLGQLPPTLFDTGAFTNLTSLSNSTQTLTPNSGVNAYDLNAPFWSDNAHKTRWFFPPPNGMKIGFSPEGNWSFPQGMAWVKHFDLQLTNGSPESTRRLETRVLVRTSNSVYGVTYRWGDSINNAVLVPDGGLDEAFVINDGGNIRTQIWRYPSRSDCNACHTAGGGWGLGFNTAQLNRDFGYAGGTSNQIAFMSGAGFFSNAVTDVHSLRALAPATDESSSLEWRVRSYLAANCASCHHPGGTALGNWTAGLTNSTALAGLIHGPLVNNGGNTNARVITPGSLTNSMLLTRLSTRGPGQMPPVGSTVLDAQSIALLSRWITNDLAGGWTNTIAPLTIALTATNGGTVQFIHPPNRAARVETAPSLDFPIQWSFLNVPANRPTYPATSNAVSIYDGTNAAQKFYRVRLTTP